ncbi:hypothetical protein [Aestuariispira insulae]|uniref:Uncharacterized protein n=1 Tax=Aestuariispira insulae TaxID=1461337 RepID=A0A3D9H5K7_9PROT|nr:hypothetical protein [Aestuariispira insulae]RED44797.1 hypothetical protein DFP90_1132 [Aestuariispira insulae]
MNRNEFEDLVDTYGGRLQRWPVDERGRAERFLEENPDAWESLNEMQAVERVLAASRYEKGPAVEEGDYSGLVDKIMADIDEIEPDGAACANDLSVSHEIEEQAKIRSQSRQQGISAMVMAGVLAASLFLGVFTGGGLSLMNVHFGDAQADLTQVAGNDEGFTLLDLLGL